MSALGVCCVAQRSMVEACGTAMRTPCLLRPSQVFASRSSRASTASEYQSSGVSGKLAACLRSAVASSMNIRSILSPWSAAIALPHVTSTASNFTPSVWAIALPIAMPRPVDHSPVLGSFEYQGGACVTPTRSTPRFLIASSVPSARAANGIARAAPLAAATANRERRLMVMNCLPFLASRTKSESSAGTSPWFPCRDACDRRSLPSSPRSPARRPP